MVSRSFAPLDDSPFPGMGCSKSSPCNVKVTMRLLCLSARPRERGVCRFEGECKANLQTQLFRSVDGGLRNKRVEWLDLESGGCMMEVVSRSDSLCVVLTVHCLARATAAAAATSR
jgi:hypothetical protein